MVCMQMQSALFISLFKNKKIQHAHFNHYLQRIRIDFLELKIEQRAFGYI
jgi:hypothetical protein